MKQVETIKRGFKLFTNIEVKSIYGQYELIVSTNLSCSEAIPRFTNSKVIHDDEPRSKMEWGINSLGIVHFGLLYDNKKLRPGSNKHWSSNSEAFKKYTDIKTMPCTLIPKEDWKMATHILIDKAKEILPEGYFIGLDRNSYRIFKL